MVNPIPRSTVLVNLNLVDLDLFGKYFSESKHLNPNLCQTGSKKACPIFTYTNFEQKFHKGKKNYHNSAQTCHQTIS